MESEKMYDSTRDADIHKDNIQYVWGIIKKYMQYKIDHHDDSKYMDPEKPVYDKYIPLLRKYKYGTPEYKKVREEMERDGLTHHYAVNRHHPEHFEDGIAGSLRFSGTCRGLLCILSRFGYFLSRWTGEECRTIRLSGRTA